MAKNGKIVYLTLMLTGVNFLLRLISTSFQIYLSGSIGSEGIGLLQLVLSVGGLSLTAGMAGIRTATMYLTAEELGKGSPETSPHVLSACNKYSILCSGAVATLLYMFAPTVASHWIGNESMTGAIRILAGFLPATCLYGVMIGYYTAANRIGTLSVVEVIEQFFTIGITYGILTLWAKEDTEKACYAVVMGNGAGACLSLLILTLLRIKDPKGKPIPMKKRILNTAVPLALADDLKAGINTTENIMVPKRLGKFPGSQNPLGEFGTVCGMVFPVLMFPATIVYSLAELLIPEMARVNAAGKGFRIRYLTKKALRYVLRYGLFISGLFCLMAKPLCNLLYKSEDAGFYLSLYAPLVPMLYADAIVDSINKGLGKQTITVRNNIITAILDILGLFLLLPRYGMIGYFISFLITHILNFLLSVILLIKTTKIRITLLFPLLSLAVTVLSAFLSHYLSDPLLRVFTYIPLFFSLTTLFGLHTSNKKAPAH